MTDPNLTIKEENENVPACCLTCGNYKPQFFAVAGKECAAFGTIKGIKWERCGAWCKRIAPPKFG
jgi:hypothetical protein